MKINIQVELEHGTLFLHDGYEDVEIPSDTGAGPFTFTNTCICFWVPAYDTGGADITLSDQPFADTISPTFSGQIAVPKKYVALTDVPLNHYLLHRLKSDVANIDIWNYIERDSEKSWVQIRELDVF